MSRFTDLIAGLAVVRDERVKLERRLDAAKLELAELNTERLCNADTVALLDKYVDNCKQKFAVNLQRVIKTHNRPGVDGFENVGLGLPLLRDSTNGLHDDRLLAAILGPQLKAALREAMQTVPCPGTRPLAKRQARQRELEAEITRLTRELAEITEAADQARNQLS